jgi:formylglycine-generating enzyme required for sulfatase activity
MTGRTYKRLFAIGVTIALLAGTSWGVERTWTDATGKFSVTAELVEVRGDEVVLRRQNGKQITVPLAKLSAEDRQFLTQRKEGDSSATENPFNGRQSLPVPPALPESPPAKLEMVAAIKKLMTREQVTLGGPVVNSIDMVLVPIPAGEFMMGSPESESESESESGRQSDETQHLVKITKPFYLSAHEVTQAQYEQVMGNNPSNYKGATKPVETVNWHEAVAFCGKLSEQEGVEYHLPTEAAWEYACRAGTSTVYSFGDDASGLGEYAWYRDNSSGTTRPAGEKLPNAWGLYDMYGNVAEWCQDWYGPYESLQVVSDPAGAASSNRRVLRGGALSDLPRNVRAAYRNADPSATLRSTVPPNYGFRLARTIPLSP